MPRVPQIQPNQVDEVLTPRVRDTASPDASAFGAGASKVFEGANSLIEEGMKLKLRDMESQRKGHSTNWDAISGKIKSEISLLKGQDAREDKIDKLITDRFEQLSKPVLSNIEDEETRNYVSQDSQKYLSRLRGHGFQYSSGERLRHEDQTHKSSMEVFKNNAATSYASDQDFKFNMQEIEKGVRTYGLARGWTAAQTKEALDREISNTHLRTVRQMIVDDQDQMAEGFFNEAKKTMTPEDQATAKKLVEGASVLGFSQRKTDELVAKYDRQGALEKAREIKDPEKRDATVKKVNDRFDEMKRAKKERVENRHLNAGNYLYSEATKGDLDGYIKKFPEDWAQFSVSEKRQLESLSKKLAAGFSVQTDPGTYYNLSQMAAIPQTRNKFLQENLAAPKYLANLSESDWQEMVKLQARLRRGETGDPKYKGIQSRNQIMNKVLSSAGLNPTSKNPDDQEKIAQFYAVMEERVLSEAQRQGRDLNNAEIEDIAQKMMTDVVVNRSWWFGKSAKLFEVQTAQPGDKSGQFRFDVDDVDEIPSSVADRIARELRRNNLPVTDDAIVEQYRRELVEFQLNE